MIVWDALVLLSFAVAGIAFHHVPGNPVLETLRIGAPFWLAYFAVATALGLYREPGVGRAALAWFAGVGLGLALRWLFEGPFEPIFAGITLAYTGTLLVVPRLFIRRRPSQ